MKRLLLLATLCALLLSFFSCGDTSDYRPSFTIGEGFSLSGDSISGTVIGEEFYPLFAVFDTAEDFIIFGDSTAETFLESGVIPLEKGENRFVLRFVRGEEEREYHLVIEYIPIRSFRVELLSPERTYHVGERFDPSTIRVLAMTENGSEIEVDQYRIEYEFSELGENDVGIELGGMYEGFSVEVTEEYMPVLDGGFCADGVRYALTENGASLIYAQDTEGFFAVPRAVVYEGREYPVTEIGDGAFSCAAVSGVLIPEGVERLCAGAFSECEALTWAELPETLTELGRQAFSGCTALERITLPDGVNAIPYGAFYGCTSLFRAELGAGLVSIGDRAFYGCETLKRINFPNTLTSLGASSFENCRSLSEITLYDLVSVGDRAFASCEKLTYFALAQAQNLGAEIFDGAKPTVYTAKGSAVSDYARDAFLTAVDMERGEIRLAYLPDRMDLGDEYPYGSLIGYTLGESGISLVSGYEITYAENACGTLDAVFTLGSFRHEFSLFVSYTETLLVDTDTRGILYALDPATMTATLVSCPPYLKRSKVYQPEDPFLCIVPTALSGPDGVYTVTAIATGAFDGCELIGSVSVPREVGFE